MELIKLVDVIKEFADSGAEPVRAVNQLNLSVQPGEFTALVGPSGAGKTTLLNLIGGLDKITSGELLVDNKNLSLLNRHQLAKFRLNTIGFVFQSLNLIPVLTVRENVEFALLIKDQLNPKTKEEVESILSKLGISNSMLDRKPNQLSLGQQQRVAVARAILSNAKIILADEPTASLDSKTGKDLIDMMKQINETVGTTFIFSTHDHLIIDLAERIIQLRDGEIVEDSSQ